MLQTLWNGLLDIIYPRTVGCVYCGREKALGDFELCAACMNAIEFVGRTSCGKCGKPVAIKGGLCTDCSRQIRAFDKVVPVALYRGWLKDAIYAYKFSQQTELATPFARLMSGRFQQAGIRADGIIPVPMHNERLKQRHFNHAELLARHFGEFASLPVWPRVLYRTVEKPPQHTLNRREREQNTAGAFQVRTAAEIQGKLVILLDDIYTTGFTAQACTAVLLQAGARAVVVVVLAIGVDQSRILPKIPEYSF